MPHPDSPPRRGEIYWVDFDPARGSEQAGHRPAVVISVDSYNNRMRTVVVAAITSQLKPASRVVVDLPAGRPLPKASQILVFQVTTIDKSRLEDYAGALSSAQLEKLKDALCLAWGLRPMPAPSIAAQQAAPVVAQQPAPVPAQPPSPPAS